MIMLVFIAILGTLGLAAAIDMRHRILPNGLILLFLIGACLFHGLSFYRYLSFEDMAIGGGIALGLMLLIYFGARHFYNQDAFGLGDVKLLAVAGVWLGVQDFMLALIIGALAGMVHGLCIAAVQKRQTGVWPALATLSMPAGPGFVFGILIAGFYAYHDAILQGWS